MKVFVFQAQDPECRAKFIARIWCIHPTTAEKGKPQGKMDFHPVIFEGPTAEIVSEMAEKWWASELEKAQAKRGRGRPKKVQPETETIRPPADDLSEVI